MSAEANIEAAEQVAEMLARHGVEAVVIGAVAMAAHHYIRETRDLDLGVNATLPQLRAVAQELTSRGFTVELREPGYDDPLGGVLDVSGSFGLVQVVSFESTFPAVIRDALAEATLVVRPGSPLRLVPLSHLIVLKLYAGGWKSRADVAELLARNPSLDMEALKALCARYRLTRELESVLANI